VGRMPLVLLRPLCWKRSQAPPGPDGGTQLHTSRLRGAATPLHALLSALQAEGASRVDRLRSPRSLPALPLAGLPRVLALLSLVRAAGAASRNLRSLPAVNGE
jgi:hypothetical protein